MQSYNSADSFLNSMPMKHLKGQQVFLLLGWIWLQQLWGSVGRYIWGQGWTRVWAASSALIAGPGEGVNRIRQYCGQPQGTCTCGWVGTVPERQQGQSLPAYTVREGQRAALTALCFVRLHNRWKETQREHWQMTSSKRGKLGGFHPGGGWNWKSLSRVRLFAAPWTIQSMEFSRPQYWSG